MLFLHLCVKGNDLSDTKIDARVTLCGGLSYPFAWSFIIIKAMDGNPSSTWRDAAEAVNCDQNRL